jgi:hypothetical protein
MNIPESQNLSPISYALSRKAKRSASAAGMPYVPLAPIRPRPKRGTRGPWFLVFSSTFKVILWLIDVFELELAVAVKVYIAEPRSLQNC